MNEVRKILRERYTLYKRIEYFISTARFCKIYELASLEEKKILEGLAQKGSYEKLKEYTNLIALKEIELLPLSHLRQLGKQYCIKGYYCISKERLTDEIKRKATKENHK